MKRSVWRDYRFSPEEHADDLRAIFVAIEALPRYGERSLNRILRRHPKNGSSLFSRSELIAGYRYLKREHGWASDKDIVLERLRMKPVRSLSGVTPVTILTKPFPCPGKCVFCPNDVKMPKSYLSREPGAQRAAQHDFDPYGQTLGRLLAYYHTGHDASKVELIILGGTWSFYPEPYQVWFVKRCFEALNDFAPSADVVPSAAPEVDYRSLDEVVVGARLERTYNEVVRDFQVAARAPREAATWAQLEREHARNEGAFARCVGLVVETRPDRIDMAEVERIRRLGAGERTRGRRQQKREEHPVEYPHHGLPMWRSRKS